MKANIELQWAGKDTPKSIPVVQLQEDEDYSYGEKENPNMLIHGDNLHVLQALTADFSGQIQTIYIDPPYNTGGAFDFYDDAVEHAKWLQFMRERLLLMKKLMRESGVLCVQIDDNEMAYLQLVLDEIFGRENRINTICVNMSNMSGPKVHSAKQGKRFPKIKEYILLYVKNKSAYTLEIPKRKKEKWDSEYNYIIPELSTAHFSLIQNGQVDSIKELVSQWTLVSLVSYMSQVGISKSDIQWKHDNAYRIVASKPNSALLKRAKTKDFSHPLALIKTAQGLSKLIKTDFNKTTKTARIELVFAKSNEMMYFGDHWDDIITIGGVAQEGGLSFPNGKKPEKLIQRIIEATTSPNDWVLDAFLGSGTTAAVAHKLSRKWIGIEQGEQVYSHCYTRMRSVIDGEQSGISTKIGWKGGGGFRFFESLYV